MRTYRKMKRRGRRTKKGGDVNSLIDNYQWYLYLEREKVGYSSDPEDKKYLSELETIIDIFENPKTSREIKLKYVRAAQRASPKAQKERNALQQILNPLRNEQLQKREEKLQQTRKNRENGKTNSENFTKNNWSTFEATPTRVRR